MMRQPQPGENVVITNTDWSPSTWDDVGESESLAYNISKIYAEKAIWEWADRNKPSFNLTTIHPSMVLGPFISDSLVGHSFTGSNSIYASVLYGDITSREFVSNPAISCVHVNDVAAFHHLALEKSNLNGQRVLIAGPILSGQDVLNVVNERIPKLNGTIPVGDPSRKLSVDSAVNFDMSRSLELVGGYTLHDPKDAFVDLVNQFICVNGSL
ncbi:unnamed protein product [Ambrosiozyma monospora]|uniref:Unnamed protein product n=1 Tax=Ambrosiozyma monospora TaxID=43982 RepID=A0ACB5UCW9_AMBMO|nr:unnamed protein product [Ambrosiozyma monospora]